MFDNGGGFFSTNEEKKENNFENSGSGQKPPAESEKKTKMYIPVTIKMINDADCNQDDEFIIDDQIINDVIVCGRVYNREELPTRTCFDINDNTGCFRITFYNREENVLPNCLKQLEYKEECYVKIFGNVRKFQTSKSMVGAHIKNIKEHDEVTNHFLQVFTASAVRRNGILKDFEVSEERKEDYSSMTDEQRFEMFKKQIQQAFDQFIDRTNRKDVSYDELFKEVSSKLSRPEFKKTVDKLVDDMAFFEQDGRLSKF